MHSIGNLVLYSDGINGDHAAIGEFQFYTAVIEVIFAGYKAFHWVLPPKFDVMEVM